MIWYVQVQYYTLGLSLKFRYRAPKTGAITTRALLSRNYNARENSLQLPNPDTRNPPSNPEPKGPLAQIGGGTFVTYPTFRTSASLSHGSPLPSHSFTHSFTEAAKTREETPHPAPSATQPEPLPRRRRPQQHLDIPHPPYRMRIHRRSHRPASSATPSSTSKELPRCSPRLSRYLHSHTAVFTCTTGRASSSPFPRIKLWSNRRHQRGCTLIAAFYS